MNLQLQPAQLEGTVASIPSKSAAHRLFIAAALADKPSTWHLPTSSVDIDTTLDCLAALGATIEREGQRVHITPIITPPEEATLNCQESGSTLRFMLPVAAALGTRTTFVGAGRLPERPIADFLEVLRSLGATIEGDHLPLTLQGPLTGTEVDLPGHVSSQYLTGLLLAAPLLKERLHIHLTSPLQSRPYVDLTLQILNQFSVQVTEADGIDFTLGANNHYQFPDMPLSIEGDWSNAAFFLAAGAISRPVTVTGLNLDSVQGDKAIIPLLQAFGAKVELEAHAITVSPAPLKATTISVREIPDLLPILAVVAAHAEGTTIFTDAERLRLKESDRILTTTALLQALCVPTSAGESTMQVTGVPHLKGNATVDSFNDHRIAMAAAIAALNCDAPLTLEQAEAVNKSYPHFYEDYQQLGGKCHGITHWT